MAQKSFEDSVRAETSIFGHFPTNVLRFSLNYLARFGIAGVVVYSCWIAFYNYNYWFTWHVVLCTFGYIPLMAESVMLFLGDELWSRQMTRTAKYTIHGIIVSLATALIICGDSVVFHYIEPGHHLYTAHGITGLISLIFLVISIPVGLVIKYHREVNPYLPFRLIWYKAIHNILGILGYVIGIVSLCYAFYTNWFIYYTTYESRLLALVVTILASLWTLNGAVLSLAHQIKSVFS
ncbi:hypothetical protein HUJ04_004687 [Dendroctonus ponderosae]|uniref:ascorbate ferrireductase (transmembrane) n=1 Tax=Dendroctonus ponderosae TaxID=77166 RepID=A0AAR5PUA5_DENPD|nr:hypothetical protein HUJ04_004687 [Dendroctonus ponderosae]KAH1007458.1 hypothetical protein HUJ04_004687 [Dendroctonus ponderosae]